MKGECRNEADHALGETLGRLGKAMVSIELRIRKLIEPARQADDLAILFHAADGCGGHAGGPEFCKAQNPARREELAGYFALIGRASLREGVCTYVYIWVVEVS